MNSYEQALTGVVRERLDDMDWADVVEELGDSLELVSGLIKTYGLTDDVRLMLVKITTITNWIYDE